MAKIFFVIFTLIIFFASVSCDESDDETHGFVFGGIFKSTPTLFEYLLQMVEETPEILETNDNKLVKREIRLNNCDHAKCGHTKREAKMNLKTSDIPIPYDTKNKAAGESLKFNDRVSGNIEVCRDVSSRHETECGDRKTVVKLQSHPKKVHVSSNLENRESKIFPDNKTKRNSFYKICSKSLFNVENKIESKINVDNISCNTNDVKVVDKYSQSNDTFRSIDNTESNSITSNINEITLDNTNDPDNDNITINMNKKGEENRRQARHKKLASDLNISETSFLTPEEVEKHIFKVDQMLQEHKRNQTK